MTFHDITQACITWCAEETKHTASLLTFNQVLPIIIALVILLFTKFIKNKTDMLMRRGMTEDQIQAAYHTLTNISIFFLVASLFWIAVTT